MAFKFATFLALASAVSARVLPAAQVYHTAPAAQVFHSGPSAQILHAAPANQVIHTAPSYVKAAVAVAQPVLTPHNDEYDPHPQYNFAYDIQDGLSGDSKSQVESRDGDFVRGQYSLIDADGYKRTVDYSADPIHGFNAIVNREPYVIKSAAPAIVKSAPITYAAAPVYVKTPVSYAAAPVVNKAAAHFSIAHH